jgi:hypothetical protein
MNLITEHSSKSSPRLGRLLFCFILIGLVGVSTSLFAQGITTAAMNGTVTGADGKPLPGANVVAVHTPSGTTYGTTTRDNGDYTLPNLRVGGPYTLTATFVGYKKQEVTNITLQLSQTAKYDFQLVEEAVEVPGVLVTGERSAILNAARTGAATTIDREKLDRQATISRTFQDYFSLSPYVFSASGGLGTSILGRNPKYSNIQIDGANHNDMFGLGSSGTPGGQASVQVAPISLDAIEEFQIAVSPFDVRQAGFTAANINVITRSGTNTMRGSAFYNLRNEYFAGYSPDVLQAKLPNFKQYTTGFRLGGPIVPNKLFFFVNGELARQQAPFTRTFGNDKVGINASTANPDSIALLTRVLKDKYGYDVGSWTSIPQDDNSDKFLVRLDYNLSESHKVTARYSYLKADDDNSPSRFRATADVYSSNARYLLQNKTHSVALQLSSIFSNRASNELIAGYTYQFDNPIYYGQAFPTVEVRTVGTNTSDRTTIRLAIGSEEFRHQNELGQKYFEITDNLSWYLPNHTIVVGGKASFFKFRNLFIPDNFGFYQYNSIAAFINQPSKPAAYTFQYSATSNPRQEANWSANQWGFYAQDEWTVNPRLKVIGGVRLDIPTFPDGQSKNITFDTTFNKLGYDLHTDVPPKTSVNVSPRLGFNYSIDEERNTQVRGGLGIFYGRFPYVWVSNQYSNNGVDFYQVTTAPDSFIPNPAGQPKIATTLPTAEVDITDPNFKAPSIFRTNLALDHRLPLDFVASVEGIFSWTRNDVYYQNINLKGQYYGGITPNGRLVGENREVWDSVNVTTGAHVGGTTRNVSSRFTRVMYIRNTDKGSNSNIILQLQRENPPDGIIVGAAYTWTRARDVGGQNSTTARSGWRFNPTPGNPNNPPLAYADNDRRHKITANLQYRFTWGDRSPALTLGLFYAGFSGQAYSWVINGDVNGDGEADNDLIYIPKNADDVILVEDKSGGAVAVGQSLPKSDPRYAQLMSFIDNDEYMREHKGQMLERNALKAPWSHQVNLRASLEFPMFDTHKLEVALDILNFTNLLNRKWGWLRFPGQNNPFFMNFSSIATATNQGPTAGSAADIGKPRYIWTNPSDPSVPHNTLSRWSAQVGVRYTF